MDGYAQVVQPICTTSCSVLQRKLIANFIRGNIDRMLAASE